MRLARSAAIGSRSRGAPRTSGGSGRRPSAAPVAVDLDDGAQLPGERAQPRRGCSPGQVVGAVEAGERTIAPPGGSGPAACSATGRPAVERASRPRRARRRALPSAARTSPASTRRARAGQPLDERGESRRPRAGSVRPRRAARDTPRRSARGRGRARTASRAPRPTVAVAAGAAPGAGRAMGFGGEVGVQPGQRRSLGRVPAERPGRDREQRLPRAAGEHEQSDVHGHAGGSGRWPRMIAAAVAATPTCVALGPPVTSSPAPNASTSSSTTDAASLREHEHGEPARDARRRTPSRPSATPAAGTAPAGRRGRSAARRSSTASPADTAPVAAAMISGAAMPTALRSATSGSDWVRSRRKRTAQQRAEIAQRHRRTRYSAAAS